MAEVTQGVESITQMVDDEGRLTYEGLGLLREILDRLERHEGRLTALENPQPQQE